MLHIVNDKCIFCIYIFRILGRLYIHIYLSLKFKISAIWLVAVAYMNLMFLIATMEKYQWNVTGRLTGNTKHFNLNYPKTYMWKYRVEQHLFVLNLHSTWIKNILLKVTTLKVSQNLNSLQNMLQLWNEHNTLKKKPFP